jgi:glycosyltransferase involved in cell wall biosynthesis
MRILLSAYACEPGKGSEPGVGWHWATELAKLGHQVDVLTRTNNRGRIEAALAHDPIAGLCFHYYDLPRWAIWLKRGRRNYHLYYALWQRGVFHLARKLVQTTQYDVVHHLTFGVFRQPSLLGRLGLPFVLGPLGGGDSIPQNLRSSFPRKRRLTEFVRETMNHLACLNPSVRAMYSQATLIFCRTEGTRSFVAPGSRPKTHLHRDVGIDPQTLTTRPASPQQPASFLYAGSLSYLKGIHLALQALAIVRRHRADATLTVIGGGEDEQWLKNLAAGLGISSAVRWLGKLPQSQLWEHYARHTAFVFPSMRDSGGTVVLEALSQALPVICLDTGGPGAILPPSCGFKIPVKDRTETQVVADLAHAMQLYLDSPKLHQQAAQCALEAARSRLWSDTVSTAYSIVEQALHLPARV